MIQSNPDRERHTIPRWNSIKTAQSLGELSSVKTGNGKAFPDAQQQLKKLLEDWKTEKNLPLAIEIISTTKFIQNAENDIGDIVSYAEKTVSEMSAPPTPLYEFLFSSDGGNALQSYSQSRKISTIKKTLANYPHNPLLWSELSREYVIDGNEQKGEKAIHVAYGLAPNNRSVLRAIARFYTHVGDPEQALFFLRKGDCVKADPWIMSAEIAISNELKKPSRNVKLAQSMIINDNYNPLSISELAGELGTMDFLAGNNKQGKKKLALSIKQPFENTVAQIAWINKSICNVDGILASIESKVDCNYEAMARISLHEKEWENAMSYAEAWQDYQPFSREPAIFGSFISTDFLFDSERAIKMINRGLLSNPDNADLLNNYVYALILSNNLEEARSQYYRAIDLCKNDEPVALIATGGMLEYRLGNPSKGKERCLKAIEKARKQGNQDVLFRALLCFAREEKRQGHPIDRQISEIEAPAFRVYFQQYQRIIENYKIYSQL